MEKFLAIDADLCTGCRSCEMACSLKHDNQCSPQMSRIRIQKFGDVGVSVPIVCVHCGDPVCEKVCPTGARMRNVETGAVITNEKVCIGCKSCSYACPFSAPIYHPAKQKMITCDLCEGDPQCARACTPKALVYASKDGATMIKKRRYASLLVDQLKPPVAG